MKRIILCIEIVMALVLMGEVALASYENARCLQAKEWCAK